MAGPGLSIIVPTRNEAANIAELVRRIDRAVACDASLEHRATELIVVDDSTDGTPQAVAAAAAETLLAVRCVHRERPEGGLGGAVVVGLRAAVNDLCLVMDADLQHPPERIGDLYRRALPGGVDVVVASRYVGGGSAKGLASALRRGVSGVGTLLLKAMFPIRLAACTDPMTGFFLCDRRRIDLDGLKPQGFKILLEMLARQRLRVAELPFDFASRHAGQSKASFRQGLHFLRQMLQLRFGRMSGFALVGAAGAVVNVALVWLLTRGDVGVLPATLIAAEVTIVANFLLQDRLVFGDLRRHARGFWGRFLRSFSFNNVESSIRIALVLWFVDRGWMSATMATAVLLAFAFVLRYVFHALVVYAPKKR
ncbi:MAG: glycosyltransferase [Leucobacter sp.]|nr:glycosyltransferase [Leucobacter sp.]